MLSKLIYVTTIVSFSWLVGCGAAHALADSNDFGDDKILQDCRAEGRDAMAHDAGYDASYATYTDCKKEAGF